MCMRGDKSLYTRELSNSSSVAPRIPISPSATTPPLSVQIHASVCTYAKKLFPYPPPLPSHSTRMPSAISRAGNSTMAGALLSSTPGGPA